MRKIIIIRSPFMYCDGYTVLEDAKLGTVQWEDVTDERYNEIDKAVGECNNRIRWHHTKELYYHIVELSDVKSLFKNLEEFLTKEKEASERYERKRELEKQKKEKAAQERKRKQLEKLKKELGEK